MKIILWTIGGFAFALLWMFRSSFPFMSWSPRGVEVIYNLPENSYTTGASASYKSYSCSHFSIGNMEWIASRRSNYFTGEQISPTQYRVFVSKRNNGFCGWSLQSITLNVKVKDAKKLSSKAPAGEGRFPSHTTINLGMCYRDDEDNPRNADMYQDGVLVINDELTRSVDYTEGFFSAFRDPEEEVLVGYYVVLYSQYKRSLSYCGEDADGKQKIIYNATYDPDISIAP